MHKYLFLTVFKLFFTSTPDAISDSKHIYIYLEGSKKLLDDSFFIRGKEDGLSKKGSNIVPLFFYMLTLDDKTCLKMIKSVPSAIVFQKNRDWKRKHVNYEAKKIGLLNTPTSANDFTIRMIRSQDLVCNCAFCSALHVITPAVSIHKICRQTYFTITITHTCTQTHTHTVQTYTHIPAYSTDMSQVLSDSIMDRLNWTIFIVNNHFAVL
ncbi:unnamed protein product [Thelazia callipaeda]|uniref:Secreted protein n=1 Tax=Thelazia callipaeda TaxID=103827 RepID=A0A0N5D7Z1_THECL|nr:unnamed protein product [Thelazia callipaeda]